MATYVDSALMQDEQVLHRGKVSMKSMIPAFVGGGLLCVAGLVGGGLAPLVIGGFWIGTAYLRRMTTELAVTNKRVIAKSGLISRSTVELNLTKVESVRVEQSMLGRMLGYGSIFVGGTGATHAPVRFVEDPLTFKQAVTNATDAIQSH